jgi:hypothetical protein
LLTPALRTGVTGDRIEKPEFDVDIYVRNVVAEVGGGASSMYFVSSE